MNLRGALKITKRTFVEFIDVHPFPMAAALSYYALLSLAPLLLVLTGATGLLLGEETIRDELLRQARDLVGEQGVALLETVANNVSSAGSNLSSLIIGILLSLVGATTVFAQLQWVLNRVWQVEADPSNAIVGFLKTRLLGLAIVVGLGFLLLISLVISAALSTISAYFTDLLPAGELVWQLVNTAISIAFYALLLGLLFRYVPDAEVAWQDTVLGAVLTATLLTLGKYLIGLYLGQASVGSAYGAAGSAVIFMVWVYYASLIMFFGAVLTRVVARARGRPLIPSEHAKPTI